MKNRTKSSKKRLHSKTCTLEDLGLTPERAWSLADHAGDVGGNLENRKMVARGRVLFESFHLRIVMLVGGDEDGHVWVVRPRGAELGQDALCGIGKLDTDANIFLDNHSLRQPVLEELLNDVRAPVEGKKRTTTLKKTTRKQLDVQTCTLEELGLTPGRAWALANHARDLSGTADHYYEDVVSRARVLYESYRLRIVITVDKVEPGDVLVVRPKGGSPGANAIYGIGGVDFDPDKFMDVIDMGEEEFAPAFAS